MTQITLLALGFSAFFTLVFHQVPTFTIQKEKKKQEFLNSSEFLQQNTHKFVSEIQQIRPKTCVSPANLTSEIAVKSKTHNRLQIRAISSKNLDQKQ